MHKLKHKLVFMCLVLALLLGQTAASPVSANHDVCSGGDIALENCITAQREDANIRCFENNEGNNDAIAACVDQVNAHFSFNGPRDDAPPLPSDALPETAARFEGKCKESGELNKDNCGIISYIVLFTNVLSGVVGVVIVIMIAVGGIQYTTARDDPQQVSAAKTRIRNAILALVFYLFGFAFLNWLIPGGVF